MMKRLFAVLLALCCLMTSPALAQDDIWTLYALSDGGMYLLGTASPCGDGMLLSVDGVVLDGMTLYVDHADSLLPVSYALGLENGALILNANGVTGTLPAASSATEGTVSVTSATQSGSVTASGKLSGSAQWRGISCLLLNCSASLTVGAQVTDAQGALVGLVAAVWGEGQNNYVVLPAQPVLAELAAGIDENAATIYDNISDTYYNQYTAEPNDPAVASRWLTDFTVTAEGSLITVDWSETSNPAAEGEVYYILFLDLVNPFYSYMTPEEGKTSTSFYVAPDRAYAVWVQHCKEGDISSDVDENALQFVTTEFLEPFAEYEYYDSELYVGFLPAGTAENTVKAEAPEKITVASILDPETDFCLQAVSHYTVTEEITMTMQTVLTTPEGYSFILDSSYIFMPEIQDNDVWNASLDDVFAGYQQFAGFISTGEYHIAYYFDGQLVGSLTFTVE